MMILSMTSSLQSEARGGAAASSETVASCRSASCRLVAAQRGQAEILTSILTLQLTSVATLPLTFLWPGEPGGGGHQV